MSAGVSILMAVVGLFIGSFVWRAATNQAAGRPLLGARDEARSLREWLPVLGFLASRAEPRAMWRLPFEALMAVYWGLAAHRHGGKLDLTAVLVFSIPLAIIMLVDFWTRLIHTNVILIGIVAGLAFAVAESLHALVISVLGMVAAALVFALFFFVAAALYRNVRVVPFGLGDVYLAAMIGAMVRIHFIAPALFLGIILGGVAVAGMLALKQVSRRQAVAYGPYLALGAMIVLLSW